MLWLFSLVVGVQSLFFTLEPGKEQCFSLTVGKGHNFGGAYLISGKGEEFVMTRVYSPSNKVLYNNPPKAKEGEFKLNSADGGVHKLCFRPIDSSPKVISFEFEHEWDELDDEDFATEESLRELGGSVRELFKNLHNISRNIHFFERRERTHRDLTEQTCDRVAW
eukprot:CAMPEP_0204896228 /NCGR_PEP_ID=MMETSP1397-20131031/38_1 /ASSEMBLY_ACC=CAM_ASM_000891 /TAXON_ID=49980 /ORGANISM="Climacostomum Climacostomum virens, Strain Stock W-24" /LENGTH=164 /DNA_ID=CAMNT_0052063807 /DNA_START=535 /DNA_END=1026 /DNA_ORIENTATION=-